MPTSKDMPAAENDAMPADEAQGRPPAGPRVSAVKVVAGLLVALAVFVFVDAGLTFALVPYGSKSQVAWTEFDKQEQVDTVVVGTSLAAFGFDPAELDARAGTRSFSMATPGQTLEESLVAIRTAYERYGVKRVVLSLSDEALTRSDAPHPSSPFLYFRSFSVSVPDTLGTTWDMLFRYGAVAGDDSIATPFPWVWGNVGLSPGAISDNVRMKLDGTSVVDAAQAADPGWTYFGQGYGNVDHVFDPDVDPVELYFGEPSADDAAAADDKPSVDPSRELVIADICAYCAEQGIELFVVETPVPVYNVLGSAERFYERHAAIGALLSEQGCAFYDFNFAKPELLQVDGSCFNDREHLNAEGARRVSAAMAQLFARAGAEQTAGGLFLTEDEHRAISADWGLQAVLVDVEDVEGGLQVDARALAGENVAVECRMLARPAGQGDYQVVRDYSEEGSFLFHPSQLGTYDIRVEARRVGSELGFEHCREVQALY